MIERVLNDFDIDQIASPVSASASTGVGDESYNPQLREHYLADHSAEWPDRTVRLCDEDEL